MKKATCKLFIIALFILTAIPAFAENYVGIGLHTGLHNNVGRLDSYDPDIQIEPQNNYILGFSFKTNLGFLFARFGVESTFLLNKGKVLEDSSEIAKTRIQYLSIPLFIGYNFNVLDVGNFYMGPGYGFFMARGRITSSVPSLSGDIDANGMGLGFITGIEYELSIKMNIYFEWLYFDAKSEPAMQGQSTHDWDDFYIDFSGHRLILGFRYYLL